MRSLYVACAMSCNRDLAAIVAWRRNEISILSCMKRLNKVAIFSPQGHCSNRTALFLKRVSPYEIIDSENTCDQRLRGQ